MKFNSKVDKVIVVDPGKNTVKVVAFNKKYEQIDSFRFPSMSEDVYTFDSVDGFSPTQYRIELNGEKFLVGDGLDGFNLDTTKVNRHHQLCIYAAVAKVVDNKDKVRLVVGFPSSDFVNESQVEMYEQLLIGADSGNVSMKINGVEKTFTIESISVHPEGLAFKPRMKKSLGRAVHVIDIGGKNTNFRTYSESGTSLSGISLDEAGINTLSQLLEAKLRKIVRADLVDVNALNMEEIIRRGEIPNFKPEYLTGYSSSREFVHLEIKSFIQKSIIKNLAKIGTDLRRRGHFIIFTGGGSLMLESYIRSMLPQNEGNLEFSQTAQWDNCISYTLRDIADSNKLHGGEEDTRAIYKKVLNMSFDDSEATGLETI